MTTYLERAAADGLAQFVRCAWLLRDDAIAGDPMPIVPDGSVEIVLNLGDVVDELTDGGGPARQPRAMFVGQPTRPVVVRPTGTLHMVGIRIQPWASRVLSLAGVPATELANRSLDAVSLGLREFPALLDELHECADDPARLDLVMAWLSRRAARMSRDTPPAFVPAAVRAIQQRRSLPSIRGLAAELGVTMRSLQRGFSHDVGLGPKSLHRIARVQRAIGLSRADESLPWSAVAARAGYYDESHLHRDFHDFTGCTPSEFAPRAASLTGLMLESRER